MNILETLWYGNIRPVERDVQASSRYAKLTKLIRRHEDTLLPLLSDEAKELYAKLMNTHYELIDLNESQVFTLGFKLGARIQLAILDGADAVPSIDD